MKFKIIILLLGLSASMLSCRLMLKFPYALLRDREVNVDGIAEMREVIAVTNKNNYSDTYTADGVLMKGIEIWSDRYWPNENDTISKRCITYPDILFIKKYLKDSLYKVKSFRMQPYSKEEIRQCTGLFELRYFKEPNLYLIPVVKLPDTILVNCDSVISEAQEIYLKERLSDYYDTAEVRKRVEGFRHGNRVVPNIPLCGVRRYGYTGL